MGLNQTLINYLRAAQNARKSAVDAFTAETSRYKLTTEGRVEALDKLTGGVHGKIDGDTAAGLAAIDKKIEELNRAEADGLAARYRDTEYIQRLHVKLELVNRVAAGLKEKAGTVAQARLAGHDYLADFLSEFHDDPAAIAALRETLDFDPMGATRILPADTTGVRQERLEQIKGNFASAMAACAALADEEQLGNVKPNLAVDAIVDNLVAFLMVQTDNFDMDATEVWSKRAERDGGVMGAFDFRFKHIH